MLLHRPVTAFILVLATFIFGYIALRDLSVDLLPDVDRPALLVQTQWSGASAREIETRINEPMEGVLSTIPGLEGIHSFARQGQSIISLEFAWGRDMNLAFLNTREKLDQVRFMMPEQAGRPQLIYTTPSDEPVAVLSVRAVGQAEPDFSTNLDLKRWSEQVLTRRLEQIDGVAQAVLVGAVVPEVHIRFDAEAIDRFGLSIASVRNAVRQANVFSASGELRDGWYRYSLTIQSRIQSLDDIGAIPLMRAQGGDRVILLSDVAEVSLREQDPTSFSLLDGYQTLTVLVKKDYGSNTVNVFAQIEPVLQELSAQFPGIEIEVLQENASYISNSISNLLQTLAYGGLLAFMVLFLFLNDPRLPFSVGIAIPVSIFLTFFVMYLGGVQLNIISLSGLTLGIGLLVDNAIVVLENINRYRREGHLLMEAARRGTREIALAITASTLTTISVFLPLLFLGGFEGAFFRDQAFTLSISLLASLLVALAILPVLVVKLGRGDGAPESDDGRFTRGFNTLLHFYEALLQASMRKSWVVYLIALAMGALAVLSFYQLPKGILPETQASALEYQIILPGNTSLVTARDAAGGLSRHLEESAGVKGILSMGGYTDQTNLSRIAGEGLNKFTLRVPVNSSGETTFIREQIDLYIQARTGWTAVERGTGSVFSSILGESDAPVVLRMVGIDREFSENASQVLSQWFADNNQPISMQKQYPEQVNTWQIRFDSQALIRLGLTEQQVIEFLESRARGNMVTEWNREDESISIRLFSSDLQVFNPMEASLTVRGRQIPLRDIAHMQIAAESEQLERLNQTPVLSYTTDITLADWWWNKDQIQELIRSFTQQTGVEVRVGGSALQVDRLLRDMMRLLGISLLIIYIILAVQYESLRYPALILFAVPFAWIGSLLLLWMVGASLNTLSFMGILILTGIAVNDAILKVDFMRRYYEETGNLRQAIVLAGKHRFRPVVMTTLTTVLGLIPMLIPFGDGYEFRFALATALIGGMLTSTLLTLFVIPNVFFALHAGRDLDKNVTSTAENAPDMVRLRQD
jgi:hydrophobic/amphiphilic exporter-1 (mainly G- bacteria), HAE1 family